MLVEASIIHYYKHYYYTYNYYY